MLLPQYVAHFSWDRRLEMLHDVAAGMSYLHGKDHVHGDLRSPNLFVGADGKVRLGPGYVGGPVGRLEGPPASHHPTPDAAGEPRQQQQQELAAWQAVHVSRCVTHCVIPLCEVQPRAPGVCQAGVEPR